MLDNVGLLLEYWSANYVIYQKVYWCFLLADHHIVRWPSRSRNVGSSMIIAPPEPRLCQFLSDVLRAVLGSEHAPPRTKARSLVDSGRVRPCSYKNPKKIERQISSWTKTLEKYFSIFCGVTTIYNNSFHVHNDKILIRAGFLLQIPGMIFVMNLTPLPSSKIILLQTEWSSRLKPW